MCMKVILNYLYDVKRDVSILDTSVLCQIIPVAERFGIIDLKEDCIRKLCNLTKSEISITTSLEIFKVGYIQKIQILQSKAIAYLKM